jgi:hypothetical protein
MPLLPHNLLSPLEIKREWYVCMKVCHCYSNVRYYSRFIPKGVAQTSKILAKSTREKWTLIAICLRFPVVFLVIIHTYHSRLIPEGVAEASQIFLRDAHVLPK